MHNPQTDLSFGYQALTSEEDYFLRLAAATASATKGCTSGNPAVGCVIVKNGSVVASGATAFGGRPHAETAALAAAGDLANEADLYVTLEPCAHTGKTPPCVEAVIRAGVRKVTASCLDPDSRVCGRGFAALRAAGIEVKIAPPGQAYGAPLGFVTRVNKGRPYVTLKVGVTLDGYLATLSGDSVWVTGGRARTYIHRLRAEHDAIMVGAGTVRHDNPMLTCRIPGLERRSPIRVTVTKSFRFSPTLAMFQDTSVPVMMFVGAPESIPAGLPPHVTVEIVALDDQGQVSLPCVLSSLATLGINDLFVEGGGELIASFLRRGLWDRLEWMAAPRIVGSDGVRAAPLPSAPLMNMAMELHSRGNPVPFHPDYCSVFEK